MKHVHRALRYFSAATCLSALFTAHTAAQPPSGLMAYAGAGMIEAATTALDGGANVNERDARSGDTPLMRAARNARSEMVLFLLKRGADAKAINSRGETALTSFGGSCMSPDAAKALVAGAGNPKEEMHTALLSAAGALSQQASCLNLMKFFVENGADPNYQDGFGNTALISASRWGNREGVRFLLTKGADPSLKTKDGHTAMDEAAGGVGGEIWRMLRDAKRGQQ
jgi:ankyrin repeat protein